MYGYYIYNYNMTYTFLDSNQSDSEIDTPKSPPLLRVLFQSFYVSIKNHVIESIKIVFSHSVSSRSCLYFGFITFLFIVIKSLFCFVFLAKAGVSSSSRYSNVTWQDYYFP